MNSLAEPTPSVRPWYVTVLFLVVVVAIFMLAFNAFHWAKDLSKALVIEQQNLSTTQVQALQRATKAFEAVKFFDVDLQEIHRAVSALSWVESAKVSRDWRHGVRVSVVPRKAVANFGSGHLVDANAVVFVPADDKDLMNPKLSNVYGETEQAGEIMQRMRQVNTWFASQKLMTDDIILTPRQTWVIRFNNGLRVIVDHEHTEQKLYTLATLLNTSLAKDLPNMQSVDLRYKNGMAIAWKQQADLADVQASPQNP